MDINTTLALARQSFERLLVMRSPTEVRTWQPSEAQRSEYVRLAETTLDAMDRLAAHEARKLLADGTIQTFMPDGLLRFVRDCLKPQLPALRSAVDMLDPEGKELRVLLADSHGPHGLGPGRSVRATFEQGIEELYGLINRNPGDAFDKRFFPDRAEEVLDSKLIAFEPDSWLDRAGELAPVRTDRRNLELPAHVRFRLEEIFRTYVFGCWLSVLSLSRGILEYSLLDNATKFGIETSWPADAAGKAREKKLSHLVDDFSPHLPTLTPSLKRLRELGNDYLHPKKSQVSKQTLFNRQQDAREAIILLVDVVEAIYQRHGEN